MLLYVFKLWRMSFHGYNHVKEWERGGSADPERNVEQPHIKNKFLNENADYFASGFLPEYSVIH